jgi:hypothetical protein
LWRGPNIPILGGLVETNNPGEQKEFPDAFPLNRNAGDNERNKE